MESTKSCVRGYVRRGVLDPHKTKCHKCAHFKRYRRTHYRGTCAVVKEFYGELKFHDVFGLNSSPHAADVHESCGCTGEYFEPADGYSWDEFLLDPADQ